MKTAYSLLTQSTYDIHVFSHLESNEIERLRRALLCTECKEKSAYQKKSKDGKAACFKAHHLHNCSKRSSNTKSHSNYDPELILQVDQIITRNDVIDLDFSFGSNIISANTSNSLSYA